MTAAIFALVILAQERISSNEGCIECHKEQRDDWKESVHFEPKVSCIECHGEDEVDPTSDSKKHRLLPPFRTGLDKRKLTAFCAQCHQAESDAFMKSVHYEQAMDRRKRKMWACRDCHDFAHLTSPADPLAILDGRRPGCLGCHDKATDEYRNGAAYIAQKEKLAEFCRKLEERLADPKPGISQAAEGVTLEACRRIIRDAPIRQHGSEYDGLGKRMETSSVDANGAYHTLQYREKAFGDRFYWLAGILGLLGVNALLIWARGRKWRKAK